MNVLYNSVVRTRLVNCSLLNLTIRYSYLSTRPTNKLGINNKILNSLGSKRFNSSNLQAENEAKDNANLLKNKLQENKHNDILVYSHKTGGSLTMNLIGLIGGLVLIAVSYNSWYIFASPRTKERKEINQSGIVGFFSYLISSDNFKIITCSLTALLGLFFTLINFFF
jgi:hypothetical protein